MEKREPLRIEKDPELTERGIPFGLAEVWYPEREAWRDDAWRALEAEELSALHEELSAYERHAVFDANPYYRWFKKYRKTYPVMQQLESYLRGDRPFPDANPLTELPFLAELRTRMLMGTHDVERMEGGLVLFAGTEKAPFPGMRGEEVHTYPGDVCGRDGRGIILSLIAGADARTCARPESRHVFYPVFGTPGQDPAELARALERLARYAAVLAPAAELQTQLV